ncbi:MAG: hypothetical protein QMD13_07160 [Candidatus Bathyarchaeia archaeon]|nr:hypothetical protein [Candidatus Bathyarchaeia archaeon]
MPVGNYRGISLREELVKRIKKIIRELGTYHSVAEFVSEAVRLRIETLEKQCKFEEERRKADAS